MKVIVIIFISSILTSGCIVVPEEDTSHVHKCEISSDHKTLRVVDLAKETNSYYSVFGTGLVLVPLTYAVSGTYVAINNVYHLGEEKFVCG